MSYSARNPNGQTTAANSSPVVLASDVNAPVSINASIFKFSTGNTTSAELAAGATFTGTIETALDQPSISILLTSDQPITLKIRQFLDVAGVYPVPDIVYYIEAGKGFSGSFPVNGNYIQVIATNTGTATTTGFEINTAYGNIPTSDGSGRLPITVADCVQLLTQTLSTVTQSTVIDTQGYQAVVVQVSGVWSGESYFESSVDNNVNSYQKCFFLPDGTLALEQVVSGNGLYIVRPAGRYLRLNVTQIQGSMTIKAIGRTASVMTADQSLSLAMDRQNNLPLFTELNPDTVNKLAPAQSLTQIGYFRQDGIIPINMPLLTIDCTKYAGLSIQFSSGTTGAVTPQWSNDGATWVGCQMWDTSQGITSAFSAASTGMRILNVQARYLRLICTTAYTAGITFFIVYGSQQAILPPNNVQSITGTVTANIGTGSLAAGANAIGDVGIQYRANATGAATVVPVMSPATPAGVVSKASAGRLLSWHFQNSSAAIRSVKIFNTASAITMGTTAATFEIDIPAGGTASFSQEGGLAMTTGIGYAVTGAKGFTDNTAITLNDVSGFFSYV